LKQAKLDARVMSVGNIQVGGAGKTPLVTLIANEAAQRGMKVCILTRGYRSEWEKSGGIIRSGSPPADSRQCGDEPALLHDLSPFAFLGVGANRVAVFQKLLSEVQGKIDLVILDDGFQNWKIKKDLEIVAVTSARWGDVLFRDRFQTLSQADLLVWTKGKSRPKDFGRPMVHVDYRLNPNSSPTPLWLVTGIAHGKLAYELALEAGYSIVKHLEFRDHAHYDQREIERILKGAQRQGCHVALTGKDWVKWRDFGVSSFDVVILEPKLEFVEGKEIWTRTLWGE
jgi:tetraacyldisaccharide 4'-kinase